MYLEHIYLVNSFAHPMVEYAPNAGSRLADSAGNAVHRHLTLDEKHGVSLEKQCEATILASPWHVHHRNLMVANLDAGNTGMKVAKMLEEI